MDIGGRLREARVRQGLVIDDVASRSGLSRAYISQIETGKASPSIQTLQKLAATLGLSVSSLFVDDNAGCTVTCHGDGVMRSGTGSIDTWHWKATRNNGSGWLDDKHMVAAASGASGRKSDDGAGIAVRNRNPDQTAPNYQSFMDPSADAMHLHFGLRANPDDAGFIVGRNMPFALGLTDSSGGSHDGAPLLFFKGAYGRFEAV